jgi:hypothetical protein
MRAGRGSADAGMTIGAGTQSAYASFVIATTIPIRTNATIAICIQIQVGDMLQTTYFETRLSASGAWVPARTGPPATIVLA